MEQEFCQFSGKLKIKCGNFPIKSNLPFFGKWVYEYFRAITFCRFGDRDS